MGHMTQQSLAFDGRAKIENSEEYTALVTEEAKLLKEIDIFKEALESAYSDLRKIRSSLRPLRKKAGTYKTANTVIYEYVRDNPGKRFMDIASYVENMFTYQDNKGSRVINAKDAGVIKELENGTYVVGTKKNKTPYGTRINYVMEYARQVEWFGVKECKDYIKNKCPELPINNVAALFIIPFYAERFDKDKSGKFAKYRLKDQYRSL